MNMLRATRWGLAVCGLGLWAACGEPEPAPAPDTAPVVAAEGPGGVRAAGATGLLPAWGAPLWQDEFDGTDLKPWWYKMPHTYAAGNSESQWYRPENLEVSAGTLKIHSRRQDYLGSTTQAPAMPFTSPDGINRATPRTGLPAGKRYFTSGMINTREGNPATYFPLYGKYEIRARLPHGQGLLPAFWLRRKGGASSGEVDVMEYFFNYRPGRGKFSLHFPNTLGVNTTQQLVTFEPAAPGTGGWHTWSVEITPAGDPLTGPIDFKAFLDGVQYGGYQLTDAATLAMLRQPGANSTWDICLNTAVGGKWVGEPDQQLGYLPMVHRCSRTQAAPGTTGCATTDLFFVSLPAVFEIDYVRVYSLP
ncbi:glycoside hydrolase family 16 protein [Corallococcus sp. ZKHCc1 1396]|uniref:Glycoside hydrolase family 16 protein n=1 Tax=Corallococcus soli TaxID=2710757 RepID=A0ABR9PGV8_9BACT|nr:glycoside hydrolase family 16 protein [Corallococcus soli]MBE4747130.1 glycoside hydrolase family 16 protein [Corallococcus soli]